MSCYDGWETFISLLCLALQTPCPIIVCKDKDHEDGQVYLCKEESRCTQLREFVLEASLGTYFQISHGNSSGSPARSGGVAEGRQHRGVSRRAVGTGEPQTGKGGLPPALWPPGVLMFCGRPGTRHHAAGSGPGLHRRPWPRSTAAGARWGARSAAAQGRLRPRWKEGRADTTLLETASTLLSRRRDTPGRLHRHFQPRVLPLPFPRPPKCLSKCFSSWNRRLTEVVRSRAEQARADREGHNSIFSCPVPARLYRYTQEEGTALYTRARRVGEEPMGSVRRRRGGGRVGCGRVEGEAVRAGRTERAAAWTLLTGERRRLLTGTLVSGWGGKGAGITRAGSPPSDRASRRSAVAWRVFGRPRSGAGTRNPAATVVGGGLDEIGTAATFLRPTASWLCRHAVT